MAAPTKAANLKTVIVGSTRKHSASVIFLHGSDSCCMIQSLLASLWCHQETQVKGYWVGSGRWFKMPSGFHMLNSSSPPHRQGGFSMGGGMAMHLAYRFHHDAAGVFALSSFLNEDSVVYKVMTSKACLPPLFACQGLRDNLVLSDWSKETVRQLSDRGALCEYHTFPKLYHEMNAQELHMLTDWIKKQVPDDGS
ncbi:lysophospholipase-like protein 1 isoform X2 [Acanthaster planci]|uniref:palmitoyl-protein hydrolase n=1 Tax=Acanthaster planci TaxID=133434 RepID=A0A8B7YBL8_ACAPL|nr:lysophospholipase-like protein 1 isoform X2 [Acanthaster planci]